MGKTITLGFAAGFLAVLAFHQSTAFLLQQLGYDLPQVVAVFGRGEPPFDMAPVPPFGMPAVIAASFRGGFWGILLAAFLRRAELPEPLFGFVFGALALTLVALTLSAQLEGLPAFTGDRQVWWRTGLCNGAWGWGTALLLRSLSLRG